MASTSALKGQNETVSEGLAYYTSAKSKLKKDSLLSARLDLEKARPIFEEEQDWKNWYNSVNQLRKIGVKQGEYQATMDSLVDWERRCPNDQYKIKGRLQYYQAYVLNNSLGRQIEGIRYYKECIEALSMGNDTNFVIAAYENIAYGYSKLGDQISAINYQRQAADLMNEYSKKKRLCSITQTLGKYYFHNNQYTESSTQYEKALSLCQDNNETRIYLAELYLELDQLDKSKEQLDGFDTTYSYLINDYYLQLAQYYAHTGRYEEAVETHSKTMDYYKASFDRRKYIRELVRYAEILNKNNQREEALTNAHGAICEFMHCADTLDAHTRPSMDKLPAEIWIYEAFYIKAKYFQEKYKETRDPQMGDEALFYYKGLCDILDKIRSEYYASGSQYRIGAYGQKLYADAIGFLFEYYKQTQKVEILDLAFAIAQKANSYVLKNKLSLNESMRIAGVSQDSIDRYFEMSHLIREQLNRDTLRSTYSEQVADYDSYKNSLIRNYPSIPFSDLIEVASVDDIQSQLKPGSALIKYFQHEWELYAFVITKKDHGFYSIGETKDIEHLHSMASTHLQIVSSFNEVSNQNEKRFLDNSNKLYKALLLPILSQAEIQEIDHLIIVPDGLTKQISFSTLITDESPYWNNPEAYLLNKYAINYLNYTAQLIKPESKSIRNNSGFFGMGIVYNDDFLEEVLNEFEPMQNPSNSEESRGIMLAPLKFSVEEVIKCSQVLNGEYLVNEQVTPSSILNKLRNKKIIHFSVHSLVNLDNYYESFILLNKGNKNNFKFSYQDVIREHITSELVVLSACQTSLGKELIGEGLMSMARAFIQSGSSSVMGSYWNASDKPTKEIMELFYTYIKEGHSKSKALQLAQLSYLNDDSRSTPLVRSPHFWGSWVIYGSDEPVQLYKSNKYLIITALLLSVFLVIFFKKKATEVASLELLPD